MSASLIPDLRHVIANTRGRNRDDLWSIHDRVVDLEADLASRPARRRPARVKMDPCQYCGDQLAPKVEWLGLPLCAQWRLCAGRIRRNATTGKVIAFAYDTRYRVLREGGYEWVARYGVAGWFIGQALDRCEARRLAYEHRIKTEAETILKGMHNGRPG